MGYGGPRVEFYTANQYANYASAIQREDAARVRSIVHRRSSVPEAEQLRQREEAFRAYEAAKAAEAVRAREEAEQSLEERKRHEERQQRRLATRGRHGSLTSAEAASHRVRHARMNELAQPRKPAALENGCGTFGCVMNARGSKAAYPTGRNGAAYMPGIDRDRIVPVRPALHNSASPPPWIGSYSTRHGPREEVRAAAKEEAAYYCGKPIAVPRSASDEAARQQTLREIAAEHADAQQQQQQQEQEAAAERDSQQADAFAAAAAAAPYSDSADDGDDDGAASVFSHGSSNGPICATGNEHVCTISTKESVLLHLSRYGGAMTAPHAQPTAKQAAAKDFTLPELSHRLVTMQAPSSSSKQR